MKKDIELLKVEDIGIAAVPGEDPDFWDIYILNLHEEAIKNVFIVASGYGEIDGEVRKSSLMRYYFEKIEALDIHKIESLPVSLFDLTNEYWVSFSMNNYLYDKRYLFVPGSLLPLNFITIPFIEQKGVLIR
ncbi:MAG: hypothetical protein ACOYOA_05260 [Saprospiraceae bacterium]